MAKATPVSVKMAGREQAFASIQAAVDAVSLYDPTAWYWIVSGDEMRLWSSADRAYVTSDDPGYLAFLDRSCLPTRIRSAAELWDVLRDQAPDRLPGDAPRPVPATITRRQMLLQLALSGMITGPEALAAAQTGAVPAAVQTVFDQLGPADRLGAEITWATMSEADRGHQLVAALAATQAMTEQQIDDFFRAAAAL